MSLTKIFVYSMGVFLFSVWAYTMAIIGFNLFGDYAFTNKDYFALGISFSLMLSQVLSPAVASLRNEKQ